MIPSAAAAPSARSSLADQRTASSTIVVSLVILVRSGLDGYPFLMVVLPILGIVLSVFSMWLSRVNYAERHGREVVWRHPRAMFVSAAAAFATSLSGLLLAIDLY